MPDYEKECLEFLKLKASGSKITQPEYCKQRSAETGSLISASGFSLKLREIKNRGRKGKKRKPVRSKARPKKKAVAKAPSPQKAKQAKPKPEMAKPKPKKKISAKAVVESLKAEGIPVVQANEKECHPESMIIGNCKYDWVGMRREFMIGPWHTVAEYARYKGLNEKATQLRKKMGGWKSEKAMLGRRANEIVEKTLSDDQAALKVRKIYDEIRGIYWKIIDGATSAADAIKAWQPLNSPYSCSTAAQFFKILHETLKDMAPTIQGLENLTVINDIFNRLKTGKIDVAESAVEFTMLGVQLPDVIKIMLAKGIGEDVPEDGGELVTNEKIMEKRMALLAEVENQRIEFVEVRTREVNELKEELKDIDSFEKQKEVDDDADSE